MPAKEPGAWRLKQPGSVARFTALRSLCLRQVDMSGPHVTLPGMPCSLRRVPPPHVPIMLRSASLLLGHVYHSDFSGRLAYQKPAHSVAMDLLFVLVGLQNQSLSCGLSTPLFRLGHLNNPGMSTSRQGA